MILSKSTLDKILFRTTEIGTETSAKDLFLWGREIGSPPNTARADENLQSSSSIRGQ